MSAYFLSFKFAVLLGLAQQFVHWEPTIEQVTNILKDLADEENQ